MEEPSSRPDPPAGLPLPPPPRRPGPPGDARAVRARALRGVLSLGGREAAGKLLGLAGGVVLARALDPAAFGLFAMATVAVSVLAFLNDLGLGPSLIRQAGEVTRRDLDAVFTFHLAVVALFAAVLFLTAPLVARAFGTAELTWLLRAMTAFLVARSLRTVPVLVAERSMRYGDIAVAEFAGQVMYWMVAVAAALAGLDVWSLLLAITALAATETAVLWRRTRWRPRLQLDWSPLRAHVRFGVLYKGHTSAAFVKDALVPALGGAAYGSAAAGYLTWAQPIAAVPMAVANIVARVSYPALAQLKEDREAFAALVGSVLAWTCRLTFPALAVLVGLAPWIVELVYGPKWTPAVPALCLFAVEAGLGASSAVLRAAIYAHGGEAPVLRISLAWMLATWALAAVLVGAGAGFVALAAASAAGTLLALALTARAARRRHGVAFLAAALRPALSGAAVALVLHAAGPVLVRGLWSLGALAAAGGVAALAVNVWGERSRALAALRALAGRP